MNGTNTRSSETEEELKILPQLFTRQTFEKLQRRIESRKRLKSLVSTQLSADTQTSDGTSQGPGFVGVFGGLAGKNGRRGTRGKLTDTQPAKPNPALEAGRKFPEKLLYACDAGKFPTELMGKPLEDPDPFYSDKYTFVVVSRDLTIYRFSAQRSLMLLAPLNPIRRAAVFLYTHPSTFFTLFILLTIFVNCVFMATKKDIPEAEETFRAIYTVEILIKLLARGLILDKFTFFRDLWNWIDFIVVSLAYVTVLTNLDMSAVRMLRVLLALKTVSAVPGLKIIISALFESFRRLRDIIILTLFVLSLFALVGLQLFHGTLRYRCVLPLKKLQQSGMNGTEPWRGHTGDDLVNYQGHLEVLLLQLPYVHNKSGSFRGPRAYYVFNENSTVCGDGYGASHCLEDYECMDVRKNPDNDYTSYDNFGWALLCAMRLMTLDYWENLYNLILHANGPLYSIYFVAVIFLGSYFLINLILAIVVMSYEECQKDEELSALTSDQSRDDQLTDLEKGLGHSETVESSLLGKVKDVSPAESHVEHQDNKHVTYESSSSSTVRARAEDTTVQIDSDVKRCESSESCACCAGVVKLWRRFRGIVRSVVLDAFMELFITVCIIANTLFMSMDYPDIDHHFQEFLSLGNYIFTFIFTAEAILKLVALGPVRYTSEKWNCFDMFVVIVSIAELFLSNIRSLSVLRSFRLLRIFKLAKSWKTLNLLICSIGRTMGALGNLCFILTIVIFIFAIVGMQLFDPAEKDKPSFLSSLFSASLSRRLHHHHHVTSPNNTQFNQTTSVTVSILSDMTSATDWDNLSLLTHAEEIIHKKTDINELLRWNFMDFTHSLMMVFRIMCGEWLEPMWDCMEMFGFTCIPFFILVLLIGNLLVLNLFLALLLSSFSAESLSSAPPPGGAQGAGAGEEAASGKTGEEEADDINKLQEALERIQRCFIYFKVKIQYKIMPGKKKSSSEGRCSSCFSCFLCCCCHAAADKSSAEYKTLLIQGDGKIDGLIEEKRKRRSSADSNCSYSTIDSNNSLTESMRALKTMDAGQYYHLYYNDTELTSSSSPTLPQLSHTHLQLDICHSQLDQTSRDNIKAQADSIQTQPTNTDSNKVDSLNIQKITVFDNKTDTAMLKLDQLASRISSQPPKEEGEDLKGAQRWKGAVERRILYKNYRGKSGSSNSLNSKRDSDRRSWALLNAQEVTVVYGKLPTDCCPKRGCRCKYRLWEVFMRSTLGKKFWAFRCYVDRLVDHSYFQNFILLVILISSFTLTLEDIHFEEKHDLKNALKKLDKLITVIFVIEMLLMWIAYGLRRYFTDGWCLLDFTVVVISLFSAYLEIYHGLSGHKGDEGAIAVEISALKSFRALRPLKTLSRWEGMRVVVNSLLKAIPSIFNVLLVCMVFWLIFGILGVHLFGSLFCNCVNMTQVTKVKQLSDILVNMNKTRCIESNLTWRREPINFDNVISAYLAMFQVATFEGWIEIMEQATDHVEKDFAPRREARPLVLFYFVAFIVFGAFFTLNLFVGVIIDNFNAQQQQAGGSVELLMTEDQRKYYNAMKKLGRKQPQKPTPKPKTDFQLLFFKLVKHRMFDTGMTVAIIFSMIVLALEYHDQTITYGEILGNLNDVFLSIFIIEAIVKLIALRFHYFRIPWNLFDFFVVIGSLMEVPLYRFFDDYFHVSPRVFRMVRVFRISRIIRLVRSAKGIRTLLFSLAIALPALFNIALLLFLITFIYAVIGMSLFMHANHSYGIDDVINFETFISSMLLLFQTSTAAGWDGVLAGLMAAAAAENEHEAAVLLANEESPANAAAGDESTAAGIEGIVGGRIMAIMYMVSYLVITFLVIINMYIAVILESFNQATEEVEKGLTQDDIDMYYEIWDQYDEYGTHYIDLLKLEEFVDTLRKPLRIARPNHYKLISLDIPICEGDKVHCVDILDSLTKEYLGTSRESATELGDIKKRVTSTIMRQREVYSAIRIQKSWRRSLAERRRTSPPCVVSPSPSLPLSFSHVQFSDWSTVTDYCSDRSRRGSAEQRHGDSRRKSSTAREVRLESAAGLSTVLEEPQHDETVTTEPITTSSQPSRFVTVVSKHGSPSKISSLSSSSSSISSSSSQQAPQGQTVRSIPIMRADETSSSRHTPERSAPSHLSIKGAERHHNVSSVKDSGRDDVIIVSGKDTHDDVTLSKSQSDVRPDKSRERERGIEIKRATLKRGVVINSVPIVTEEDAS